MSNVTPQLIKELRDRTGVGMSKCKDALLESSGNIEQAIDILRKAGVASAVKKESRAANEGCIEFAENDSCIALLEMNAETDFVVNNEKFASFHRALVEEAVKTKPSDVESFLQQSYEGKSVDEKRKELISVLGENILVSRVLIIEKKASSSYGIYSHMNGKIFCLVELEGSAGEEDFAKEISMHVAAEAPDYLSQEEVPQDILDREMEVAKSQVPGNKPPEIVEKIVSGKIRAYFDTVCLLNQKYIKDSNVTVGQLVEARGKEIGHSMKVTRFIRWQIGG